MIKKIPVKYFYKSLKKRLKLTCLNNQILEASDKVLKSSGINRPGLALAGFFKHFAWNNIQIFTRTEVEYIKKLENEGNVDSIKKLCEKYDIPCFVILTTNPIPEAIVKSATENGIPVFKSILDTFQFYRQLSDTLEFHFAPTSYIHGTLVDVYGTGLLIMGRSGIGKSEIALDLVERGHRLVTDDVVTVFKRSDHFVMGRGQDDFNPFMEIRGVGIINVKEIFGTRAIRTQKRVELVVNLEDWNPDAQYERVGLDEDTMKIHGVSIPRVKLPIFPGKNVTVICETIALDLHLKVYGYNAAKDMNKLLIKKMKRKQKLREYLTNDYE